MKTFLSVVSFAYIFYGLVMLAVSGFLTFLMLTNGLSDSEFSMSGPEGLGLMLLTTICLALACFAFLLSYLLFKRKHYTLAIILASSLLLGVPIGTFLGMISLSLLQLKDIKFEFQR